MQRATRGARAAAVVAVAFLLLGACGKSKSASPGYKGATTTAAAAGPTTAAAAGGGAGTAVVKVKKDAKLGMILADAKGLTLYTLTNAGAAVPCSGTCASVWPPLAAPAASGMPSGPSGITLTVVKAADGSGLVAAGGLPLYRFVQDKDAGDAYGDGLKSFGGVWHVVKAGGGASTPTSGGATTTTAAKGPGY